MKQTPQFLAPVVILRAEVEAWRTAGRMSREAVAIAIVEKHKESGADLATELSFDYEGSDTFARARKSAQKIFRWLDEGNLPANMIPSILAALPAERQLAALNQMFTPMGIEARSIEQRPAAGFDVLKHLRAVMKEGGEGQMALVTLPPDASHAHRLAVHKELAEAAHAFSNAADELLADATAQDALARASISK